MPPNPTRRRYLQLCAGGASADRGAGTATATESESIGLAAGGAKDVAAFRRNVEEGYLTVGLDSYGFL